MNPAAFWNHFEIIKKDLADESADFGMAMETLRAIVDDADEIEAAEVDTAFNRFLAERYPADHAANCAAIEACEQEEAAIANRYDEEIRAREEKIQAKKDRLIKGGVWTAPVLYDANEFPAPKGIYNKALFAPQSVALVQADGGVGKSTFMLDLAHGVSRGLPVGYETREAMVHAISEEMTLPQFRRKLLKSFSKKDLDAGEPNFRITCKEGITLDKPGGIEKLQRVLRTETEGVGPHLVLMENLINLIGDGDENSNRDMGKIFNTLLNEIAIPFNCCVVVFHHVGNPNELRGGANRGRGASCMRQICADVLTLTKNADGSRLIEFDKTRDWDGDAPVAPLTFTRERRPKDGLIVSAYAVSAGDADRVLNLIKENPRHPGGTSWIQVQLFGGEPGGKNYAKAMALLDPLMAAGKIGRDPQGPGKATLWYPCAV